MSKGVCRGGNGRGCGCLSVQGGLQGWQREGLWVLECPRGFAGVATGGVVGA